MTPREKAEACFAVARSSTHEGERKAAIGRGERICSKHGLALDSFDIPGRPKRRAPDPQAAFAAGIEEALRAHAGSGSSFSSGLNFTTAAYNSGSSADITASLRAAMNKYAEALRAAETRAASRKGETAFDARRRNFETEAAEARQRDAERDHRRRLAAEIDYLSGHGFSIYPDQPDGWLVYYRDRSSEATDQQLLDLAAQIRVGRQRRGAA